MLPSASTSWHPLARARCSKLCWVNDSPALVPATIPTRPPPVKVKAAVRIASKVVGGAKPGLVEEILAVEQ